MNNYYNKLDSFIKESEIIIDNLLESIESGFAQNRAIDPEIKADLRKNVIENTAQKIKPILIQSLKNLHSRTFITAYQHKYAQKEDNKLLIDLDQWNNFNLTESEESLIRKDVLSVPSLLIDLLIEKTYALFLEDQAYKIKKMREDSFKKNEEWRTPIGKEILRIRELRNQKEQRNKKDKTISWREAVRVVIEQIKDINPEIYKILDINSIELNGWFIKWKNTFVRIQDNLEIIDFTKLQNIPSIEIYREFPPENCTFPKRAIR